MRSTRLHPHRSLVLSCFAMLCLLVAAPAFAGAKTAEESHDAVVVPPPPPRAAASSRPVHAMEADAPPHIDDPAFKVAALLGYSTNDLNLGVGARVGKNHFFPHVYVGGTFVYQLGHSVSSSVGGITAEASLSAFYVGPEVGYDFDVAPVVVRVYAGVGIAGLTASSSVSGMTSVSETTTRFVVWPGAMATYDLPDSSFFVAADVRFLTVPGGPAVGLFALGGTRF